MERRGVTDDVPLAAALDLARGTPAFQARRYARIMRQVTSLTWSIMIVSAECLERGDGGGTITI